MTPNAPPEIRSAMSSSPAAPATRNKADLDFPVVPSSEAPHAVLAQKDFRPQSSPAHARLTKRDLRDLIRLCDVEIGHCGLDQESGQRAAELREKLVALHAHGSKEGA